MNADLNSVLSEAVDTASNGGLTDRTMTHIRRGVATRRAARDAGKAIAAVAAVGAIGSIAVLAGSGRLPFVSGVAPSDGPSTGPSGSAGPEPSVGPTLDDTWETINAEWPDEGPSWSQNRLGIDSVDVIACGVRLEDLPTSAAITMETPMLADEAEVQRILDAANEGYGETPEPGETIRRETDRYTPADDAWVAAWGFDRTQLPFAANGATISISGVEEGFAPWDAFDYVEANIALQLWSGFVVVDGDSVVIGRGHYANPEVGAGTLSLIDGRGYSGPPKTYGEIWTLTSNTAEAIEWCPGLPHEVTGTSLAVVAAATTNAETTVYVWRPFPAP